MQIAYQVVGEGPLDIVLVPSYLSNTEMFWELPSFSRFYERLASFSRLILFDRRGSGMSDGIAGATPLEEQIDDVQAVIDAVGCEQPVLASYLEGCGLTALHAASHPGLVRRSSWSRRRPAWWPDRATSGHPASSSARRSCRRS